MRHLEANTIKFCEFKRERKAAHLSIDVDHQSVFVFVLKNGLLSKTALVMSSRSDEDPLSCKARNWTSNPDVVTVKDSSRQRGD